MPPLSPRGACPPLANAPRGFPSIRKRQPVNDLSVIDSFLQAFITYIDSGFGLLGGEVHFLTATLIGIDVTLAGLFWAMGGENDVIGRFIRKVLYIGAFAYILNSFSRLANIIFQSFAQAGLTAGGGTMSAADLLKPGRLAGTGFSAAWPLLNQASQMLGFTSFFDNFLTIAVLLFAWVLVVIAFFILAVQMFVTILEFKLTSLAGFILVPFALWNRTSFLAERVLGNVVSSGIKVRQSTQDNVARAGDQITQHNLNIQPTITIRPGAIVRLVVHKDLVLAPWHGAER